MLATAQRAPTTLPPPPVEATGALRWKRATATSAASLARLAVAIASQTVLVAVVARVLDSERFGVWVLFSSLPFWVALADLGVTNTIVNGISQAGARRVPSPVELVSTAALLQTVVAVLGLALMPVVAVAFDLRPLLGAPRLGPSELAPALAAVVVPSLASVPLQIGRGVYLGFQEGWKPALWETGGLAAATLLSCLYCAAGQVNLPTLLALGAVPPLLARAASCLVLFLRDHPEIRPRFRFASRRGLSAIVGTGSFYFLAQLTSLGTHQAYPWIIATTVGAAAVGPFALAVRILSLPTLLVSQVAGSLFPAYGEAAAKSDWSWIRRALGRIMAASSAFSLVSVAAAAIVLGPLVTAWAGGHMVLGPAAVVWVALYAAVNGVITPLSSALYGLGRPRGQALYNGAYAAALLLVGRPMAAAAGVAALALTMFVGFTLLIAAPIALEMRSVLHAAERRRA